MREQAAKVIIAAKVFFQTQLLASIPAQISEEVV
jgi:hypothetical protein